MDAGLVAALAGFLLIAFVVGAVVFVLTDDARTGAERCADGDHAWPLWIGAGMANGRIPCGRGCGATRSGRDWTASP